MVCLESIQRVVCTLPRWVIKGIKVYYLEARPNFIGPEGLSKVKRLPIHGEHNVVVTEQLFVNSQGNTEFRVKSIVDQFTETVCVSTDFSKFK